jgi:4-hydroxybenzoyl-CoA thioesterase
MLVNRRTVRIEWGDCDPAGIVWYPRYFGIFDASTQHLFEAAGFPKQEMIARFGLVGYPMVDTRARFLIPSKFGDDIIVESRVSQWRRSSFDIEHAVFKEDALAIQAFETRVMVRRTADGGITSCATPSEIVAAFSPVAA